MNQKPAMSIVITDKAGNQWSCIIENWLGFTCGLTGGMLGSRFPHIGIVAHGSTREEAIERMAKFLNESIIDLNVLRKRNH